MQHSTTLDEVLFLRVKAERAVAALRRHALYQTTQPGLTGDDPVAFGCEECRSEWKPGEPEKHAADCPCILLKD